MKDVLVLIEKVALQGGSPEHAELLDYCRLTQESMREFCNRLALSLARGFQDGKLSYEFCDDTLNCLFNFIMEPQFLESDAGLPHPAFDIFQAFDAADYYRDHDAPDDAAVAAWTRPRIDEILRQQAA